MTKNSISVSAAALLDFVASFSFFRTKYSYFVISIVIPLTTIEKCLSLFVSEESGRFFFLCLYPVIQVVDIDDAAFSHNEKTNFLVSNQFLDEPCGCARICGKRQRKRLEGQKIAPKK
jgi:hypothetical protein